MHNHRPPAVKFFFQFKHRLRFFDRLAEKAASQHRLNRQHADEQRRDRQQNQRQRNHPTRLVRLLAWCQTVMLVIDVRCVLVMRMPVVIEFRKTLFTMKRKKHQTERIQAANEHATQRRQIGNRVTRRCRGVNRFDDRIFGEESGERWKARVGQRANQHREISNRQILFKAAHFAHVLLVMHGDNHRPRTEKQHRLKKRVRHQMEYPGRICPRAQRHRHVAQLREC